MFSRLEAAYPLTSASLAIRLMIRDFQLWSLKAVFFGAYMLKCNRCGKRDSEKNKPEIFIVAMCEQPAPAANIDTHMVVDWAVVQDTGFVTCEDCMIKALGLLEAFYGGSKE